VFRKKDWIQNCQVFSTFCRKYYAGILPITYAYNAVIVDLYTQWPSGIKVFEIRATSRSNDGHQKKKNSSKNMSQD
jgi:hypothetical protein